MAATVLVIKSWSASGNPDVDQNYVNASAHAGSIVASPQR